MSSMRPKNPWASDDDSQAIDIASFLSAADTATLQAAAVSDPAARGRPGGTLTTYTSGDPTVDDANEFNIQIDFTGRWTASEQAIVKWAADFYSSIIAADIRDDTDLSGQLIDDIVITMSTGRIDGRGSPLTGNVLAVTDGFVVRDDNTVNEWLPLRASITLDSGDLRNAALATSWDDIILHEMGHALGFIGFFFSQLQLVDGSGNFIGPNAMLAYGGAVPLESGGSGLTIGSHWAENGFMPDGTPMPNELMTGFYAPGEQTFLSDTTLQAFADLGYTVADPSADSFLPIDSHLLLA